ncbi:MAG: hypothetical protein ACE5ID_08480 [Acidobacteriota bacterium]
MSNRLPTPWQGTLTAFTGLVLLITLGMVVQWWSVYAGLLLTEFGLLLGPALFLASRWDLDLVASFRAGRGTLPGLPGTVAAGACIGVMAFVMALGLTLDGRALSRSSPLPFRSP